jgi:hypothetical protein
VNLTPAQERTLVELMGSREERPVFPRELAARLRTELEERLAPAVAALPEGEQLFLPKSRLADLHARCEGLFVANYRKEGVFSYSMPLAVGKVSHKAVEVSVYRPDLTEAELVAAALQQIRRDDEEFDSFCRLLDDAELAGLEGESVRRMVVFRSVFPAIERSWAPAVEMTIRTELAAGRVVLIARPDLALGTTDPTEPMRGRRLLLELKTGSDRPEHDEDVRLYALVATLFYGVPPFRVATIRLDDGRWRHYDVTEDLLFGAARRVADGCIRAAALLGGEDPALRPGVWCRWCPRSATCPESTVRGEAET